MLSRQNSDRRSSTPDEFQRLLDESRVYQSRYDATTRSSSVTRRQRGNTITSLKSGYGIVKEYVDKRKFLYLTLTSLFLYLGFMAVFAPRTSLSMDFRWLHSSRLTTSEVYRIYLNHLEQTNMASRHVYNFSNTSNASDTLCYIVQELRDMGFKPRLENYYPWTSELVSSKVQLIVEGEPILHAALTEECLEGDDASCDLEHVKAYHSYSANGNATAPFIYSNYATAHDYHMLLENGIDPEDKIHIVRYGGGVSLGLKLKNAELYGASAVLMYNDPRDDGEITEWHGYKPYPYGPARNNASIQKGTAAYISKFPGDPTTPGYASKHRNTEHLSPAGNIPRIPSIPINYKDANSILAHLNGKGFQFNPQNGYFSGPSKTEVQLNIFNEQKYNISEISNIVVEIPGIFSEGDILIGSHRDMWNSGTSKNPNSGAAVMLEIARGFAALLKSGWRPLRSIKLISWGSSENNLLGSVEYSEDHHGVLKRNTLAYLNLDRAVVGTSFDCEASPLLHTAIYQAAKYTILDDRSDKSLFDEWSQESNATIGVLNGISDHLVFQTHLGIPSATFEYKANPKKDAVNHYGSNYNTFRWLEDYVDPDYTLHNSLARMVGLTSLIIAESEVIPFSTYEYLKKISDTYTQCFNEIRNTFPKDRKVLSAAKDLEKLIKVVANKSSTFFDISNQKLAAACSEELALWQAYKKIPTYSKIIRANAKLMQIDKLFLATNGLAGRGWFKHSVYSLQAEFDMKGEILPGVQEAIAEHDRDGLMQRLTVLTIQLNNVRLLLQV